MLSLDAAWAMCEAGLLARNRHGVFVCRCCGSAIPVDVASEENEQTVTRHYELSWRMPVPHRIKEHYAERWGRPWQDEQDDP